MPVTPWGLAGGFWSTAQAQTTAGSSDGATTRVAPTRPGDAPEEHLFTVCDFCLLRMLPSPEPFCCESCEREYIRELDRSGR